MLRDILCSSTGARSSPGCLDDGPSAFFHILNLIGTEAVKIGACCMCCGGFIQHLILPAQLVSQKKKKNRHSMAHRFVHLVLCLFLC